MTTYTNQILEMTQFEDYKLSSEPVVITDGEIKKVMVAFTSQLDSTDYNAKPHADGNLVNLETGKVEFYKLLNNADLLVNQCKREQGLADVVIFIEDSIDMEALAEEKAHQKAQDEMDELVEYLNTKMDGKGTDGYSDHIEGYTGYVTLKDSNFDGINSEVDVHHVSLIAQRDIESTHTTISATMTYFHFEDKRDYTKEWEISTVKNSNTKPHQTIKKITREIEKEISCLD